ncbi:MAG: hypothetical protein J6568_03350 [Snodgrassella sp.]|nr:hypothetical protein [Snodgrassella sp.]
MQRQESHCVTIVISCAIVGLSHCADDDQPQLADNVGTQYDHRQALTLGFA